MSPLQQHDRLREIRVEIDALDERRINEEREANGLIGLGDGNEVGRAEAAVLMTRLRIDQLLREHMQIAEGILMARCPVHPTDALIASCDDCCRAWGYVRRAS